MRLRYTDTAFAEIQDIFLFIEAESPKAAAAVVAQIEHTIGLIRDFPHMGTVKYRQVVRMVPVRRYPKYLVFYAIEGDEIIILNVRHGARRPLWKDDNSP
jgi:toxin ParE1/3/4